VYLDGPARWLSLVTRKSLRKRITFKRLTERRFETSTVLERNGNDRTIDALSELLYIDDVEPRGRDAGDEDVLHVRPIETTSAFYETVGTIGTSYSHAPERQSVERATPAHDSARESTRLGVWSI
jgi:hypothetical protein